MKKLWSVALPIGNGRDLSPRARAVLESADGILAEDTRRLLDFAKRAEIRIPAKIVAFPSFEERSLNLVKFMDGLEGDTWALVSDAGTPCINDPGAEIVRTARFKKIDVAAVPGPSALTLAVQLTGGFGLPLSFGGFVPKKDKESFFTALGSCKTFVFFDTKHEISRSLDYLCGKGLDKSSVFLLRELTKEHEELWSGTVGELKNEIAARLKKNDPIGEMTLVMQGHASGTKSTQKSISLDELAEIRSASPTKAAKLIADLAGCSREAAYEKLLNK